MCAFCILGRECFWRDGVLDMTAGMVKDEVVAGEGCVVQARVDGKFGNEHEAREIVLQLIRSSAAKMTQSAIEAAKEGELGHLKYLFEIAGIHPKSEESDTAEEEKSFTYGLLKKLGLPTEPGSGAKDRFESNGDGLAKK
jgi:hypothetical protein